MYAAFAVQGVDLRPAHAVLWWAQMTTEAAGEDVRVEDRPDEISARYSLDDLVTRFIAGLDRE